MAIPKFYESTDASAPTLTGENGSLIAVLDAVLVDGYGSKAGAGWSKAYSATNKAVYQSARGRVLHVMDDGSRIDSRFARISGAASATGPELSDLVDVHPSGSNIASWAKSFTATSAARPWKILATANQVLILVSTRNQGDDPVWTPYFAGYLINSIAGDTGAFIVSGYYSTANAGTSDVSFTALLYFYYNNSVSATSGAPTGIAVSSDGSSSAINAGYLVLPPEGITGTFASLSGAETSNVEYPSKSQGSLGASPIYVFEIQAVNNLRGQIPGLYRPLQKITINNSTTPASPFTPFTMDIGFGERTYRWFPTTTYFGTQTLAATINGGLLLDINSDWDLP